MNENKFTTYLLYAIGEIILVVVGILIAVSIDDWNKELTSQKKEAEYLTAIRFDIEKDIAHCMQVLAYNQAKSQMIMEVFKLFQSMNNGGSQMGLTSNQLDTLFSFQVLGQTKIAFDNMVSSESIGLIKDPELRTRLSEYYSLNFIGEERTKQFARKLNDQLTPLLVNKQMISNYFSVPLEVEQPSSAIPYYRNSSVISTLVNTSKNIEIQSTSAEYQSQEANNLIVLIDEYLKN